MFHSPPSPPVSKMFETANALIVDDDPIARKSVRLALESEGFQCQEAVDGEDASRRLLKTAFDLVVTDLRMPNKHGHALATELVQLKKRPFVVVYSAVDDANLTKDLVLRGVDDIIYKPANCDAIAAKMSAFVSRRSMERMSGSPPRSFGRAGGPTDALATHEADAPTMPEQPTIIPADAPVPLSDIEEKLSMVLRILPVSKGALDVFEMARDGCDASKLGEAIRRDAALAAEVLSIANSNFYNPSGKPIAELDAAVVRIGQRRTGELALAASTLSGMATQQFSWLDTRTTWRQSIAAGAAVELLADQGGHGKLGESLGLVAIMHSLGRVLLGTIYPSHYRRLVKQCEKCNESLVDHESQIFPENHAMITARLLAIWKIPKEIWQPMNHILESYRTITQLPSSMRTKVELIKLAVFIGQLATRAWHPWDRVEIPPASLLKRLGIHDIANVLEQTRRNVQAIVDFRSSDASESHSECFASEMAATDRTIIYANASDMPFDLTAQLIKDMGIGIVPLSADNQRLASAVVINGIGAAKDHPQSEVAIGDGVKSLLLTDRPDRAGGGGSEERLHLPTSFAGLRTALLERAAF